MDERMQGRGGAGDSGARTGAPEHRRRGRSRWLTALAVAAVLLVVAGAVLWQRCGLHGCPDVDMLRGYMPDEASVLVDRDGDEIGKLYVTRRVVVPVDSMPEHLLNAFVAIEDRRFWSHGGVDWQRVGGALLQNIRARGVEEGSSTITMQLARNVFPDKLPASERSMWRKLGEARVARQIEGRYGKRDIIELYLNQIYFGSGAWGVQAAAEEYFGKDVAQLTLAESALLAALPRAPSRLNPRANRDAALEGRDLVLRRMVDQGMISEAEKQEAAEARARGTARQRPLHRRLYHPYDARPRRPAGRRAGARTPACSHGIGPFRLVPAPYIRERTGRYNV
jgi:membrane peptidoglycan carboxypeptidase